VQPGCYLAVARAWRCKIVGDPADARRRCSRWGVHSTFFGPIKYAILPQHLQSRTKCFAGTGLVEAGTYIAILAGTIFAGWIPVEWAAVICIGTAHGGLPAPRSSCRPRPR